MTIDAAFSIGFRILWASNDERLTFRLWQQWRKGSREMRDIQCTICVREYLFRGMREHRSKRVRINKREKATERLS